MLNKITSDYYPAILNKLEKEARKLNFKMSCERESGVLLRLLASSKRNSKLLELGTGIGISTSWILDGMDCSSFLYSVELDDKFQSVAKKYFKKDPRVAFYAGDGGLFIQETNLTFDFIFADTWPGKFYLVQETLELLNDEGIYIVDDLKFDYSWSEEHKEKVEGLLAYLEARADLTLIKLLNWSTGLLLVIKKGEK